MKEDYRKCAFLNLLIRISIFYLGDIIKWFLVINFSCLLSYNYFQFYIRVLVPREFTMDDYNWIYLVIFYMISDFNSSTVNKAMITIALLLSTPIFVRISCSEVVGYDQAKEALQKVYPSISLNITKHIFILIKQCKTCIFCNSFANAYQIVWQKITRRTMNIY